MEEKSLNQATETIAKKSQTSFIEDALNEIKVLRDHMKDEARAMFFYDTNSEKTDKITKALTEFILEMPKLRKDTSAMGRYRYQGLPGMLEEINPVLAKFGLKCMQPPHTIGDTTYIITKISHVSGQYFRCVTAIPKEYVQAGKPVRTDQNLQAMGGAQTYTKRYALKAMLGIDADEDTDGGANTQQRPTQQSFKPRTSY